MGFGLWAGLALGVAAAATAEPAPAEGPSRPASAELGRELFIGMRATRNGGPPCGACHALAGEGLAFSGSLGPELSTAVKELDADGLAGLLELLPFPTMSPLYDGHPLTPDERADLAAFLIPAAQRGPPSFPLQLPLAVACVVVPLALGLTLAHGRRKAPTRAGLLARAAAPKRGAR